jgi:Ca2+-binding EF-hand superfamily protein
MWTSSCEHEQKLDYIFKVFDVNRDDAIDNEEFILMVSTPPDNNPHTFCVVLIV